MTIFHSCSIPWLPQLYRSILHYLPYLFFRTRKWQFSLFMKEEQGHRTQRIWTVKVNTEAHIVCSVNYCSNHCSALPLSTGGGTYSSSVETGLISLGFIPGLCNMNTVEARAKIYLNVSPEMPSSPEESGGNKLRGITYSISLYAGRDYMDHSGQPLVSQLHYTLLPSLLWWETNPDYLSQKQALQPGMPGMFYRKCWLLEVPWPSEMPWFNWQPQSRNVRTQSQESLFGYQQSFSKLMTHSIWQGGKKKK